MAHGNKKMPLDRYPFMDNDLKTGGEKYVTQEELDSILNNYVTKSNMAEMLRFKWTALTTSGLEDLILEPTSETEWDTNSQIFYNFFKSNIEVRSFKTYKLQKDLAKLFLRDVVDHVFIIVYRRDETEIFGFGKNDLLGIHAPSVEEDTNYLYYFTTWENSVTQGYRLSRPTRIWGNNYIPTE